ncbi:uncharacterized protein BT62DRAFT_3950 [Guyanagaster necrorhizus]|uniref:Mif2/CENP-C cupin domain-containing protein n=1 Tax=Guyanagaster necrorhizus TaxID=856835 RepID=A0A9P7W4H3_9AGAR|nr:uncharacterized protein BT62DRAFT_3950 [Guyanagaster necrorhizus MCA 3950]KAG7452477.1 hypothetical protein BT62DRAFT_3950 [Guyanagaster necrorhizus MCA 3950]
MGACFRRCSMRETSSLLDIQVSSQKPMKSSKDNDYIFYVIEGVVNVRIHQTYYTVSTGRMFMVPRGKPPLFIV